MIATALLVALVINYGVQTAANRQVRTEREATPADLSLKAARARLFEPSDDRVIEHQRRVTVAAFALCVAFLPVWWLGALVPPFGSVPPGVGAASLIGLGLVAVSGWKLIKAAVGPERESRRVATYAAATIVGLNVYAATILVGT